MSGDFRLIFPEGYEGKNAKRIKDFTFIETLQLEDLIVLINENYRGFSVLSLEQFFTTDPKVIDYRLGIVEDLVHNPALYKVFCKSIQMIQNINDLRKVMSSDFSVDAALHSVRYLEMYQEIMELFLSGFEKSQVQSVGMKAFETKIRDIANSSDYQNLATELPKMEINFGYIKSVTIGINLDENLRPKEAGILSINQTEFREGNLLDRLMKRKKPDDHVLMTPLFSLTKGLKNEELKHINYSISGGLHTVFEKSLRSFEPLIQNYYKQNTAFFVQLLDDIRFLTAGVKFILEMQDKGQTMCKPEIFSVEEKVCNLDQVYNPMLVLRAVEETIVSNMFSLDEQGRFYLVTGPNHGGKSIFTYSVGIAQALFQLGLFVPAKKAQMSPVTGIYTHFPVSDEDNYGKGRLGSECERLGKIIHQIKETDMLLMDESLSSTSALEAGYIATEVLTAIGIIGCCGLFATHIHDLPQHIEEYNGHPDNRGKIDNLVAQMEDSKQGIRSYRISRTTPDGLSYARDVAKQYGLDLSSIIKND